MSIAVTQIIHRPQYASWTFTAADADTATTITHGMSAKPDRIVITPYVTFASTATPSFAATADATSIYFTKSNTAGSGGITAGTTVVGQISADLPHSIAS